MNEKAVEPLGFAHRERGLSNQQSADCELHKNATAGAINGRVQL